MNTRLIDLPKILDQRGNLSFIEEKNHIPFKILRAYWIYDVPGGEFRGSHAFKESEEFVLALSGSFDLIIHNGKDEKKYSLNRSYYGIYLPKQTWRRLENFSTNSLALILASTEYNAEDYIRNFEDYVIQMKNEK